MPARILLVEDNATIHTFLSGLLSKQGLDVVGIAQDAATAIALADREQPDVVLTDVRLPDGRDGIEAATAIKACASTPIIFLSAATDEDTIERAKAAQPLAYLDKNTDLHRVGRVVNLVLRESSPPKPKGGRERRTAG